MQVCTAYLSIPHAGSEEQNPLSNSSQICNACFFFRNTQFLKNLVRKLSDMKKDRFRNSSRHSIHKSWQPYITSPGRGDPYQMYHFNPLIQVQVASSNYELMSRLWQGTGGKVCPKIEPDHLSSCVIVIAEICSQIVSVHAHVYSVTLEHSNSCCVLMLKHRICMHVCVYSCMYACISLLHRIRCYNPLCQNPRKTHIQKPLHKLTLQAC